MGAPVFTVLFQAEIAAVKNDPWACTYLVTSVGSKAVCLIREKMFVCFKEQLK